MSVRAEHGPERVNGELTLWGAFVQHRRDARRRDIPFLFSFDEWVKVWSDSGHLENRGPKLGQYVMARFGDTGPYSIANVKIITAAANHHEANIGSKRPKSPEHRMKLSNAMRGRMKGYVFSQDRNAKISAKLKGVPKSAAHRLALKRAQALRRGTCNDC